MKQDGGFEEDVTVRARISVSAPDNTPYFQNGCFFFLVKVGKAEALQYCFEAFKKLAT